MSVYTQERDVINNTAGANELSRRDMGLQLRFASERGRLQDVKKTLAAGAPVIRDPVSNKVMITRLLPVCHINYAAMTRWKNKILHHLKSYFSYPYAEWSQCSP
jgi:hypothetical protein